MWIITGITLCMLGGRCADLPPSEEIQQIPPAATEEDCHAAGWDVMTANLRRKGISLNFNITCEQSA